MLRDKGSPSGGPFFVLLQRVALMGAGLCLGATDMFQSVAILDLYECASKRT